ncbi:MAG TPA: hypothetical protein VK112_12555 [Fodinibius sp.]|nr:hypothetical protein [Fodinibius sp.]
MDTALFFASPARLGATLAVLMSMVFTFGGAFSTYILTELDESNMDVRIATQQAGGSIADISAITVETDTINH